MDVDKIMDRIKEDDQANIKSFNKNKDGWLKRINVCMNKLKDEYSKDDQACEKFKERIDALETKLEDKDYSGFSYCYSKDRLEKDVKLLELITDKNVDGFRTYLDKEYKEEVGYDMNYFLFRADDRYGIKRNLDEMLQKVREKHREDIKRMSEESFNGKSEKEIKDYRERQEFILNESRNVPLFESHIEFGRSYIKEMDRDYR